MDHYPSARPRTPTSAEERLARLLNFHQRQRQRQHEDGDSPHVDWMMRLPRWVDNFCRGTR